MTETTIVHRLGMVLYWAGCGIAALAALGAPVAFASFAGLFGDSSMRLPDAFFIGACSLGLAVLAWLAGRACKFILAGQ